MISPEKIAEMLAAAEKATPGPWDVWTESTPSKDQAIDELAYQVTATPDADFAEAVYLLNANGKCPALTGCGPTSAANALYLAMLDPATITKILSELLTLRAERDENYDLWPDDPAPIADKAADHVFKDFAKALGLDTWSPQDGSESWEGDVWATAVRMLEDAGVLDRETGERPDWQSRALAAEAQLARQGEALKAAREPKPAAPPSRRR